MRITAPRIRRPRQAGFSVRIGQSLLALAAVIRHDANIEETHPVRDG
jgi:hypothetical protein